MLYFKHLLQEVTIYMTTEILVRTPANTSNVRYDKHSFFTSDQSLNLSHGAISDLKEM